MVQQSPIFVKTETFMVWLLDHTRKFPRYERLRMTKRIDDALFDFHECLLCAVQSGEVRTYLLQADQHLDRLRAYLRLSVELKYTTPRQYQFASQHTTELGNLLGGWLKKA